MTASGELAAALELVPSLADHARIPASLPLDPALDAAKAHIDRAIGLDPTCAPAHAAHGNLLLRRGQTAGAQRAYALAARFDPADAASRLVLAELASMAASADADAHFDRAFALSAIFSPPPQTHARPAIALMLAGPWHRNIPLDFVIDSKRWAMTRVYLRGNEDIAAMRLPSHDLIVDALAESVAAQGAIASARAFIGAQSKPVVNDPAHLARTARTELAAVLEHLSDCVVPATQRLAGAGLARHVTFPCVLRPTDAHGGRACERIDDRAALLAYRDRVGAESYDVAEFVDYRSEDGYFRKYRVMFVDGVPYPYHLAVDTNWLIHYHRAPMAEHAWMREEEQRFLTAPAAAFPHWATTLPGIARSVGLDYFGIDCALLPDGRVLVFEADVAMLVHDFDPAPGKRAAVAAIRGALDALLERRAPPQPFGVSR